MSSNDMPGQDDAIPTPPEPEPWPGDPGDAPGASTPSGPGRFGVATKLVAPVVAAFLVGGGAVLALEHHSGSSASAASSSAGAFGGSPASGTAGGPGGGVAGEQHIQGTVAATGASTVTVKATGGTTGTYTVDASSQIEVNGQSATLSAVKVGDTVLVHVYPSSSGTMLVERLFDGDLPAGGPDGFGPPSGSSSGGTGSGGTGSFGSGSTGTGSTGSSSTGSATI